MIRIAFILFSITFSTSLFAQNAFAFQLMNTMEHGKNLFFSPTSIKAAFAMAFEGANGQTQQEFESVFGFEEDNAKFIKELNQLKSSAQISNAVWILDDYSIRPTYTRLMKDLFDAPPQFTDFENEPAESAQKINDWISKSTQGMIKNMVTPGAVVDFKMALVNAIYFKQNWKKPFTERHTMKDDFNNSDGTTTQVDMMRATDGYRAFEGRQEKVIELPYEDDKTSMIIVLPHQINRYSLDAKKYETLCNQLNWQKVQLKLPKFTFETPTFELKGMLTQLGLKQAFRNDADFSGMRVEKDLKIGTALHKAKIVVNEKGTKAAAVTVIGMVQTTSAAPRPDPIMELTVDKPFFYIIKDNASGAILFMGRMNTMEQ